MTTLGDVLARGGTRRELTDTLRGTIGSVEPLTRPVGVMPAAEVIAALASVLDMPLANLAVLCWHDYREVSATRRRTTGPPPGRAAVEIGRHKLSCTQEPEVEMVIDGRPVPVLKLKLELEINLSFAELVIVEGQIVEVRHGDGTATGRLSAGEVTLAEGTVRALDLTGGVPPPTLTPG